MFFPTSSQVKHTGEKKHLEQKNGPTERKDTSSLQNRNQRSEIVSWPSSPGHWSWRRARVSYRADLRCWLDSDLNTFKRLSQSKCYLCKIKRVQECETTKSFIFSEHSWDILRFYPYIRFHWGLVPFSVTYFDYNNLIIYSCSDFNSLNWQVWALTVDAGDWEVVFGFLPAGMRLDGSRRPTRDLALPEEGHHEGLLGARPPPAHQPDPACRQGAVWERRREIRSDVFKRGMWRLCGAV